MRKCIFIVRFSCIWSVMKLESRWHHAAGQVPTLTAPLTRTALLKLTWLLLMVRFLIQPT